MQSPELLPACSMLTKIWKTSLKDILEPVINQAINGIEVTYDLHKAIESGPQLKEDPEFLESIIKKIAQFQLAL